MIITYSDQPTWPKTRGAIRKTSDIEAVRRALSALSQVPPPPDPTIEDAGHRPIAYRLEGGFNGGFDPFAPHCASWSYGGRTPTADCIGFVLWATGVDRCQPEYHGSVGVWLHCGSLLADADGDRVWCEPVDEHAAKPGDWLITQSHIAMIIRPAIFSPSVMRFDHLVIDCSPRHGRETAIGIGLPWSESCRVLRYKHYAR